MYTILEWMSIIGLLIKIYYVFKNILCMVNDANISLGIHKHAYNLSDRETGVFDHSEGRASGERVRPSSACVEHRSRETQRHLDEADVGQKRRPQNQVKVSFAVAAEERIRADSEVFLQQRNGRRL